ncbi:CBO0543 family protein [Gracilibacillus sp. YIM 98692]|uniref:CBO0543 family protein n=1 Tax=Gracilibacillus sp. YIM 98692 TaxID=2663532 RepID=UPI0013D2A619|nr:CBO0543 family protein [Gracilibacillus sp. YIM 98692]
MHLVLSIGLIIVSFRWGDWGNWGRYYPTLLYMALFTCLYEYISHEHFHLWDFEKHFLHKSIAHALHIFIINPLLTFVFLSNYQNQKLMKQIYYMLKWIIILTVLEGIMVYFHALTHYNNWNLWWSFIFYMVMLPMLRLHFLKPKLALILSVLCTIFYLFVFDYI